MFHDDGLGAEFFGPPRPGQTDAQFQTAMQIPLAISGAVIGAVALGPVGLLAGMAGGWFTGSTLQKKSKPKPKVQGG